MDWKLKLVQHPALLVWRTLTAHGGEVNGDKDDRKRERDGEQQ